jgi:hypothetical protein
VIQMTEERKQQDLADAVGNPLAEHPTQPAQEIVDPRHPDESQGPAIEIEGRAEATRGEA